jgi:hypothetical protein
MSDRRIPSDDVDEACARLRALLLETRGLGRRDFLRALAASAAGSALLSPLLALASRAALASEASGQRGHSISVRAPDTRPEPGSSARAAGQLVAGGRYDGLLPRLGAREPIPAVGFAVWIERLAAVRSGK